MELQFVRPHIQLRRDDLLNLPPLTLPEGYAVRSFRPGDESTWGLILTEAFEEKFDADRFREIMQGHWAYRPDRVFFICRGEEPAATASAYREDPFGPKTGYVHYVACRPSHRRKGLGRAAVINVLRKFVEEGCENAVLQTEDFRVAAMKMYLDLGFHPELVHENQRERWRRILEAMGLEKERAARCERYVNGPLWAPDRGSS